MTALLERQPVWPIPSEVAEGSFHCSYCLSYDKMNAPQTRWTQVETLLKGCGVTPLNLSVLQPPL